MPGIKIRDEDRKRIDRKFICTVCELLLCMPMQSHCGHLMCFACVQASLESSNPRCPEDNTELKKEQVFPDVFTKRELKGLRLHCTNQGCSWHGTYEQLEGHSQICEHALIKCVHPQCQVKLQRSDLGEHLKSECEYRNVKCDFCAKDVAFASSKEHVESICESAPVICRYCKENVLRKDVDKHERHDCNEAPATCEFQAVGCNQDKTLKRKEVRQHLNDGLINHVWLLLQYILTFVSQLGNYIPRPEFTGIMQKIREDITDVRSGLAEKFVMIVGKLTGLERRIETLESSGGGDTRIKNEVQELRSKVRDHTTECANLREGIMGLREKNSQIDESLALNTVKIRDHIIDVHSGMHERYDVVLRKLTSLHRNININIANLSGLESTTERLQSRMDQIDESLALNTVKITDLQSERAPRAQQAIHSS